MGKTQPLSIDLIRTNGGTQMRAELTAEVYTDYRDRWLAGVEFEPVDVFHDGSAYWLADGFHRFHGAREANRESILCRVHQGTQRDAILFACSANSEHGLRRTTADKRLSITTLVRDGEWGKKSKAWIAEHAAVDEKTVAAVIRDLESTAEIPVLTERVGKDGKKRKTRKPKSTPSHATGSGATSSPTATPQALPAEGSTSGQAEAGLQGSGSADGDCPKGGEHEFDNEACAKCHEPKERPVKEMFKALLEHLRLATLLLDEINRVAPNEKRRHDAFTSLECANTEVLAWKKGAK
jgi:uncharacterized ParB-like nuclease family protein